MHTDEQVLSPLRRFLNLLKVERKEILSVYVYAIFNGMIVLSLPLGIQAIINLISTGQYSTSWIVLVFFVMAGVAFSGAMQVMQLSVSENLQQKIFTRSAFEFAYRIPRLKLEAVDKYYIPELVNRFFDTLSVQKGISKILIDFSTASIQVIFGLIMLSLYHPFFILFSMLVVLIIVLLVRLTSAQGMKTSIKESEYKYEVAHWLEEIARTLETFKLAGKSDLALKRTDDLVTGYLGARKSHFKTLRFQYINLIGLKVIITAALLLIGGLLVINQQMNIGQFVASEIIILLILNSVEKLILSMENIYDVLTAIEKIGHVTDIPLESDRQTDINLKEEEGLSVKLQDLTYRFGRSPDHTLQNIGLEIKAGEHICLTGANGAGKSTLLHIMAGLYNNFSGQISYNGLPLGNWNRELLRSYTGACLFREDIFRGSVSENISLGKPGVSFNEVREIAGIVGLSPFIESLPYGYDTLLVPEGRDLSKNVRLKIKLARSLTGKPRLILLDDNFNLLNEDDKERFLDHILQEGHTCTVVAISNDAAVASRFQRVVVLEKGRIAAIMRSAGY